MTTRPLAEETRAPSPPWRTAVWLLLVAGAVGNTVASLAAVPTAVHVALGLFTGACAVVLVAISLRRR